MTFDLHTHTVYSRGLFKPHGRGTVAENADEAVRKGLIAVAISDHGPGHLFYGIREADFAKERAEIEEAGRNRPGLRIYMSVEANILDTESGIDVSEDELEAFDFLIAGYHYGVRKGKCVRNRLAARIRPGETEEKRLARVNTDMYLKALYDNDIRILTHPGDKAPVYMDEVARACADTETLMEINTRHGHLTVDEIRTAMTEDVKFIISSDAHTPERVGDFRAGLVRAISAGLDVSRIVNIEALPDPE